MTFNVPWEEETVIQEEVGNFCKVCHEELPPSLLETEPIIKCPYCGSFNNNTAIIESEPEKYTSIPNITLRWVRFSARIHFSTKPATFIAHGVKDSG